MMKILKNNSVIFLIIQMLNALSGTLSGIFVNVYLWRVTNDFKYISLFNLILFLFIPIAFIISGVIARKRDVTTCIRLGIVSNLVFYILILVLQEKAKDYLIFLGMLSGCGTGFYCFGNNTLLYHYTDDENRSRFSGLSGALGAIMGVIAPVISGAVIYSNSELKGYYIIFAISFVLLLSAIIFSYFLRKEKIYGKYDLKNILLNRSYRKWNKILVCNFILGIRDGALGYITSILVFLVFKNELNMSKFNMVISIFGIISTYYIGRIRKKKNDNILFSLGAAFCFLGTVILVSCTSYIGVIINGILVAIFGCFWGTPFGMVSYEIAEEISKNNNMGDYMIAREIPIAMGRILSIGLYILISISFMDEIAIKIILPIVSFMVIITYLYLKKDNDI